MSFVFGYISGFHPIYVFGGAVLVSVMFLWTLDSNGTLVPFLWMIDKISSFTNRTSFTKRKKGFNCLQSISLAKHA